MKLTRNSDRFLRGAPALLAGAAVVMFAALSGGTAQAASEKSQCLWSNRIQHTQILNNHQILFFEVDGKIWLSNLDRPCSTLTSTDAIVWDSSIPKLCGSTEQVRVAQTGQSCLLGPLVAYVPGSAKGDPGSAAPTSSREIRPN